MLTPFVSKLAARFDLSLEDQEAFGALPALTICYAAGEKIRREEGKPTSIGAVVRGFASCYKLVERSKRQVTGFLMPGDAIDVPALLTGRSSAHVVAHLPTEISWIEHHDVHALLHERPRIATALWLDTSIEAGIGREWLANIGQRKAQSRILHLMLEQYTRHRWLGSLDGDSFELPFPQSDLASALGLSLVHTNKSLRALSEKGLLFWRDRVVQVPDYSAAQEATNFDPQYLWVDRPVSAKRPQEMTFQQNETGTDHAR